MKLKFLNSANAEKIKNFFKNLIGKSTKVNLYVGVPSDRSARSKRGGKEPINNASLAYINEYGAPASRIPPRPFLIPGVNDNSKKAAKIIEMYLKRHDPIENAYAAAGMILVSGIKKKITSGLEPPLSPVTLSERKRKGFKGTKPLIETGQLVNSINYFVKK